MVFLNGDTPGTDQITKLLAREKDLRVLRLFTHGSPGQVVLNGEVLDKAYLTRRREIFQSWARAFAPDADILLYGCNVAEKEAGKAFADELARLTGADVAASTNRTGGPENEWSLEYATGPVEAAALNITGYPFYLERSLYGHFSDGRRNRNRRNTELGHHLPGFHHHCRNRNAAEYDHQNGK